jgi:hypothetical protein
MAEGTLTPAESGKASVSGPGLGLVLVDITLQGPYLLQPLQRRHPGFFLRLLSGLCLESFHILYFLFCPLSTSSPSCLFTKLGSASIGPQSRLSHGLPRRQYSSPSVESRQGYALLIGL